VNRERERERERERKRRRVNKDGFCLFVFVFSFVSLTVICHSSNRAAPLHLWLPRTAKSRRKALRIRAAGSGEKSSPREKRENEERGERE
jgi:hypothetical protein